MMYIAAKESIYKNCATRDSSSLKQASLLLLLTMLVSCGGGGGGGAAGGGSEGLSVESVPDLTGTFRYLGYIDLIDDSVEDKVNRDANFFEFVDLLDGSEFGSSVPMVEDSCSARVLNAIPTNPGTINFPEVPFNLVGAGETFTLTSSAGTYAVVTFSDSRFDIAPYPSPDDLTLDLAAGTFPGFSSILVPAIPEITNFQPQDITAETVFTWTPVGASSGSIYMTLIEFASTGNIADPLDSRYVEIHCRMKNDGEFPLPQEVTSILSQGLGNDFILTNAERVLKANNVVIQGDAVLVVSRRIQGF